MAVRDLDPLAQLDRDLAALQRQAPVKAKWDPQSVESMLDWLEQEVGLIVRRVPKIDQILRTLIPLLQRRQRIRAALVGPRGGGKTLLAAAFQLLSVRFFGASWASIGGSLEQANCLFGHVRAAVHRSRDLARFIKETLATRITARSGGCITVHAASERSIRGQHPIGPSGLGGIVLDEAALIEDHIIDAAIPQVASANPSMVLQLSTLGEERAGRFFDLIQNPTGKGYQLFRLDVFDVARRCTFDCATTCPAPAHFAEDFFDRSGPVQKLVHGAYCRGRAHDVDGWIAVEEVAQQLRELGRDSFERELMGLSSIVIGQVYDPALIDAAILRGKSLSKDPDQHRRRMHAMNKAVGIDWGFAGECAVVYLLQLRDAVLAYRWEFYTRERFSKIREHVLRRCFEEHIETIYADSSNPSDNEELFHRGVELAEQRGERWEPRVLPVVFSKWKSYGIGEIRRRLEQGSLRFAPDFGGVKDPAFNRAMAYLKSYHTDKFGHPVKVDDHGNDALLAACVGFSKSFRAADKLVGGR